MTAPAYDVAIIGAGIVGAACAREFARSGMSVVVLERDCIGGGATAAGMGHIVAMDDSEAQFALTRYSRQLWQELRPELPGDVEYEQRGTIWVAADEEEMAEVERKHAWYSARGVATRILNSVELKREEPNLRPVRKDIAGGLLVPEDAVIFPPCAARFLIDEARTHGAEVILGCAVTAAGNGRVQTNRKGEIAARAIVNAAGADSPFLTPGLSVKKRKGHLVITDRYPVFVRHQLVELGYLKSAHSSTTDSVAFNVQPRCTGQVLIGSSRQYEAEHNEVDRIVLARMIQRAQEYMPAIADLAALRTWMGFRAATPDKLPLIGPHQIGSPHEDKTMFLATGHEGLGITTSLGTARLLADQLLNRKSEIPIEPYLPARQSEPAYA